MARFSIYSKEGTIRHTGEPQYSGSYMGVDYIEFRTISSPAPITWETGDYVDYERTGLRYRLYSLPMPNKVARRGDYGASFEYTNVQFFAATKELEIAPFRDLVHEDNLVHFSTRQTLSTYEDVYGIARRIQACMDELFPNRWRIEVVDTDDEDLLALLSETKEFTIGEGSCLDALSQIYELWQNVGWIHNHNAYTGMDIITIGGANIRENSNTSPVFEYGKGKGLTAIRKASANPDEFATRLYVYGSERNLQTRYYNQFDILHKDSVDITNLMIPLSEWGLTDDLPDARKAYLEASEEVIEKYGLIPRIVYFDGSQNEEIYPSITGLTCAKVREAMIAAGEEFSIYLPPSTEDRIDKVVNAYGWTDGTKEDIESLQYFYMHLNPVGFDIAEQGKLTNEGHATIAMKSGKCAGREFIVKRFSLDKNNRPELQVLKTWDDSIGESFPNERYPIAEDDIFVLLDIPMPDYYVTLASERLLEAGRKMLEDYTRVSAFYEPSIDPIEFQAKERYLRAGMYMAVRDEDVVDTEDGTDYVLIDTLTIDESAQIPLFKVTLREEKRAARTFGALKDMIDDAKEDIKTSTEGIKQYTERRFRSAQETLSMLQDAFTQFSEGISPVTVSTMAMLVGDEALQFRFIAASGSSMTSVNPGIAYDADTKTLKVGRRARLMHMTLGVEDITAPSSRTIDSYRKWTLMPWTSATLADRTKSYYLYAKVSSKLNSGVYTLSETAIDMNAEDGFYYFLVGILNAEYDGMREFVPLYGFTEILPGRITTDAIRSADGNAVLDLVNGLLKFGNKVGLSGASESERNLRIWAGSEQSESETAPFRVYDDGSAFASALALLNGCSIGKGIRIEDDAIVIDTPGIHGSIKIGEQGIEVTGDYGASLGNCTGAAIQGLARGVPASCPNPTQYGATGIAVEGTASDEDLAFLSRGGKFAGLRSAVRVIGASSSVLTDTDFNILVPYTSGTYTIELPVSPLDGQEYWLETFGADVTVESTKRMWSHYGAKYETTHLFASRGVVRFKYYKEAGIWTYTWVESL